MLHTKGLVLNDHFEIKDRIVLYYETLLPEQHTWRPKLDCLVGESLWKAVIELKYGSM